MDVKTFRANSLQEALQMVREQLGPDASVLHTRECKNRFGLFSKSQIEVEASCDVPIQRRFASAEPSASPPRPNSMPASADRAAEPRSVESPSATHLNRASAVAAGRGLDRTQGISTHAPTQTSATLTSSMVEILSELLEAGVDASYAKELLAEAQRRVGDDKANDKWLLQGQIVQTLAAQIRVSGPIEAPKERQKVVAFVGPTGVGKTITLAKIAAGLRFDLGCKVGLITVDTFRLGAVDQLLQYAELISAPLEVVSAPDQMVSAMDRLMDCAVVLIDTAGRSPRDTEQLGLLSQFLNPAEPDEVHLVVSATGSEMHTRETMQRYAVVNPTRLVITKLDEASCFGQWLKLMRENTLPISYLTSGQHVPQDIAVASPRRLASLLLGHSQHNVPTATL